MNLKISISKICDLFFINPHCVFACMRWRGSRGDDHEILPFLASKSYQNIDFDQIKNRDINLMIIYLIFYQNCNFLATHVDARSWNGDFSLCSVESSRCAANWQTRFSKLKLKPTKVDLRNLHPHMVVFGVELLIFWNRFRIWTWKYRFPKILKFYFFPWPTPCICLHAVERQQGRQSWNFIIFGLKKLSEY